MAFNFEDNFSRMNLNEYEDEITTPETPSGVSSVVAARRNLTAIINEVRNIKKYHTER